jgi:hypothetical protein
VSEKTAKQDVVAAIFGQRIYEYRDDEGVVYYSFTRSQNIISPPTRLRLQGRVGTHVVQFLVRLRRMSDSLQGSDGEDG